MEQYIKSQILPTLAHFPAGIIKSYLGRDMSESAALSAKTGGFIKGVCHPNESYEQIKAAGLEWIRIDIPYPMNPDGTRTEAFKRFKERCAGYVERGIRVMAVTPYPGDFIKAGIDPRIRENEPKIRGLIRAALRDLSGLVAAVQITNEMGLPRFTEPLTLDEAARFIGIQAQALRKVKGDILVGYNSAGPQVDLHLKMKPYLKYCDYVGIDIYLGCFYGIGGDIRLFELILRGLRGITGKPVLLQEFGYISGGAPKTEEEKRGILESYGARSESHAREIIDEFVENLPARMRDEIKRLSPEREHRGDFIFKSDFVNHLYRELPEGTVLRGYPHTPEGQAEFYRDIFPRLFKLGFVCGAFIYCYSDSDRCYVCGQDGCPTETRWGLVDTDGREKPSYYAVRDALNAD